MEMIARRFYSAHPAPRPSGQRLRRCSLRRPASASKTGALNRSATSPMADSRTRHEFDKSAGCRFGQPEAARTAGEGQGWPESISPLPPIREFDTSAWNADVDGEAARRARPMDGPSQSRRFRQIIRDCGRGFCPDNMPSRLKPLPRRRGLTRRSLPPLSPPASDFSYTPTHVRPMPAGEGGGEHAVIAASGESRWPFVCS
jgi:hypothetical protein